MDLIKLQKILERK